MTINSMLPEATPVSEQTEKMLTVEERDAEGLIRHCATLLEDAGKHGAAQRVYRVADLLYDLSRKANAVETLVDFASRLPDEATVPFFAMTDAAELVDSIRANLAPNGGEQTEEPSEYEKLAEAEAYIARLRVPLLHHFGTTDPDLLPEAWRDRDAYADETKAEVSRLRAEVAHWKEHFQSAENGRASLEAAYNGEQAQIDTLHKQNVALRAEIARLEATLANTGWATNVTGYVVELPNAPVAASALESL